MRFIKSLHLKNFQSHKSTEIEFDQYLNVIVGPSDHGKSSIIRGLKWALFNEPSGDFFIREGESECSVVVTFSDGIKVKRYRSPSKNAYYLYNSDGEETVFESFGTKVPEEIIDKTSLEKIILDSSQSNIINIADQLEGPFLLSERNSVRANSIGRLVGVNIVDDALRDTLRDVRNLNQKKKNHESNLDELKVGINKYDYLDDFLGKIKKVENIKTIIIEKQKKLDEIKTIYVGMTDLNNSIEKAEIYLKKLDELTKAIEVQKNLEFKINKYNLIKNKYKQLKRVEKHIEEDNKTIKNLAKISRLESINKEIETYYNRVDKLSVLNYNYKNARNNILENKEVILGFKDIDNIESKIRAIKDKNKKLVELSKVMESLNGVGNSLDVGNAYIKKLEYVNLAFEKYTQVERKNNILEKLKVKSEDYSKIKSEEEKMDNYIENIDVKIDQQVKEYKLILRKMEVCPLCFSNIDEVKIEDIINDLY